MQYNFENKVALVTGAGLGIGLDAARRFAASGVALDYAESMSSSIGQIPMKRIAKVSEITDTVLWLCSTGAGFTIGQAIVPDGGYSIG